MYNHTPENYICPLCQLAGGMATEKGTNQDDVIFRDDLITVFIAGKWWKANPGHVIIVPNKHIENLYDMPEETGHRIFDYSKKVAIALKEVYKCDGTSTRQHNEPAGNQDVFHFHLHIFPRYKGDNLYMHHLDEPYWPEAAIRKPYADKLRAYFSKT